MGTSMATKIPLLIGFAFGMCACGEFKVSGDDEIVNPVATSAKGGATATSSINEIECSGTYQVDVNGTTIDMTIYSNDEGQFIGTASIAGQSSEDVSGSCSDGVMTFTIAGKKYSGTYK